LALPRHALPDAHHPALARSEPTLQSLIAAAQALLAERHYVQFHPAAARLVGVKAALMLGHGLYWTRKYRLESQGREGWFWKTAAEWTEATGLTTREQEGAREALRKAGVWHECLLAGAMGVGTRLHFHVDLAALTDKLLAAAPVLRSGSGASAGASSAAGSESNPALPSSSLGSVGAQLSQLLARPVVYFRALADVAGGPTAGLLLSWLLGRLNQAIDQDGASADGFMLFDLDDAGDQLCMGTKATRNAREALERIGLITVGYAHESRGRLMVRVNLMALTACLSGQRPAARKRGSGAAAPVAAKPGMRPALERVPVQASLLPDRAQVTSQQGNVTQIQRMLLAPVRKARTAGLPFSRTPSPQNGIPDLPSCRFVETGGAVLSNPYTKGIGSKRTPTTAQPQASARDDAARRSRRSNGPKSNPSPERGANGAASNAGQVRASSAADQEPAAVHADGASQALILPKHLDAALHQATLALVQTAPVELRQGILDEFEGALASRRNPVQNALGWLHSVVNKAKAGKLVLTVAHVVASQREAARRHSERMTAMATQGVLPAAAPAAPEATGAAQSEVSKAQVERRKALAAELMAKLSQPAGGGK